MFSPRTSIISNLVVRAEINKLGRKLKLAQQVMATAQVFVRRFYTKVEIRRTNPYLVLATAVYLASKMDECPQHIRHVVSEARSFWPDLMTTDTAKLGECEFSLIAEMNSQMIVHHPYRSLLELAPGLGLAHEETALAWYVVNDHYLTDLPLLYPPHVIAVVAITLTLVLKPTQNSLQPASSTAAPAASAAPRDVAAISGGNTSSTAAPTPNGTEPQPSKTQKLMAWLSENDVDIEAVVDCTQEIISLYDVWEQYNDKVCKEQIARFVKARGLDK